jgi:branched-chain amino acid transport system substrate-binding protein
MDWDGLLHQGRRVLRCGRAGAIALAAGIAGCTGAFDAGSLAPAPAPSAATAPTANPVGTKVGLILPLSGAGNANTVGLAMRNAAEMAVAEMARPNIQLIVKDDSGTGQGAQLATQQALNEGAEVILGPLFATSVTTARPIAAPRGVPIIAFSTDATAAAPGAYLLSFLPEADVDRVVAYAISQGKRSFLALVPSNPYGTVVEGAFKQAVARGGARVLAVERYKEDRNNAADLAKPVAEAATLIAGAAAGADALFMPGGGDAVADAAATLVNAGVDTRRLAVLGSQLWDDPKIAANPLLAGAWYPGPDPAGFRGFSSRYRARYGQDAPRPAALAYDAVAMLGALTRTPGLQRITNEVLTDPAGFNGIEGVFRFRGDGTNQRGLAVLRVTPSGGQVISPAPRTFN